MGTNNLSGAWGEALAAEYLRGKGYRILNTGFRCKFGEVDIIASNQSFLVFVEVKLRKSPSYARAAEFVGPQKQKRLRTTASIYLSRYPTFLQPRFDVIEIYAPQGTATVRPEINHIEEAFE